LILRRLRQEQRLKQGQQWLERQEARQEAQRPGQRLEQAQEAWLEQRLEAWLEALQMLAAATISCQQRCGLWRSSSYNSNGGDSEMQLPNL
jgi:hypothetical protein